MDELFLFTDGSVNTKSKTGFGAYLAVTDTGTSLELLRKRVKIKRFENTSSTRLELETIIWALSEIEGSAKRIIACTDSQNIISLKERRDKLEKNNFQSRKNKPLNNRDLYIQFFKMIDENNCDFIKVQGHLASRKKDETDLLFSLVDRESRKALRKSRKE